MSEYDRDKYARDYWAGQPKLVLTLSPGRVPDVEATLRAEVAKLTTQLAERDAELATARAEFERLQARLDRALRACHIITYGDGGITECADVVGELENSKRLDELKEESQ